MSSRPFRFLHASDLHLDRPPFGVDDAPLALRETLADALTLAAEKIFDVAIAERVDFMVLAGDMANFAQCGPRELATLARGFERVAAEGIAIYWATGPAEAASPWPSALRLPGSVHRFGPDDVVSIIHQRAGEPLVEIVGRGQAERRPIRPADFQPGGGDLYSIAVAHGVAELDALAGSPIDYWALGGEHRRRTLANEGERRPLAHYPGSPQGRRPGEWGVHGVSLLEVDGDRNARTKLVATDQVRYVRERAHIPSRASFAELEQNLRERAKALVAEPNGPDLLVTWTLSGDGPLAAALGRPGGDSELVARLRGGQQPQRRPMAWCASVELDANARAMPRPANADSLLAEFLTEVESCESKSDAALDLSAFLATEHGADDDILAIADLGDKRVLGDVLRAAARLGADLVCVDADTPRAVGGGDR